MKTPKDRERARQIADQLQADQQAKNGAFTDWFEDLYAKAKGDAAIIPWGDEKPHMGLIEWISKGKQGGGAKALDVGCGLGDNAAFLAQNGYDVTAIDLSKSAIEWAAKRFEQSSVCFRQADLFHLPDDLIGRFDLVHETYTLQALPDNIRPELFTSIASLVAPGGCLLVICRARAEDVEPSGPPWPLAKSELDRFLQLGFTQTALDRFDQTKPDGRIIPHFRVEYQKTC